VALSLALAVSIVLFSIFFYLLLLLLLLEDDNEDDDKEEQQQKNNFVGKWHLSQLENWMESQSMVRVIYYCFLDCKLH
jgi:preprotein translocase subunit SecG